jgi:hypothetical protein
MASASTWESRREKRGEGMRTEEKSWLGLEGGGGVTWGRRNRAGMLADAKESGEQFLPPGSVSGEREKGKRRG